MLYIVTVTTGGPDFMDRMNQMRTWLDHRHVEPSHFRCSVGDASGEYRVHFDAEADAVAFASEFDGEVSTVAAVTAGADHFTARWVSASGSGRRT